MAIDPTNIYPIEVATVIRIRAWNQRVEPTPGTKIARRVAANWETFRAEMPEQYYEATAVYLGHGIAVLGD